MGKKSDYIAGYTYNTENFCNECILTAFSGVRENIGFAFSVEGVLDIVAGAMNINRHDENTFDSSEFPKVIFDCQIEDGDEKCAKCNRKARFW